MSTTTATTTSSSPNASTTPDHTINAFTSTNGSLSIGAKAGIALAALIVTALILMGTLFLMKRKKTARKASMATAANPQGAPLTRDHSNESDLSGPEGLEKYRMQTGAREVRSGV